MSARDTYRFGTVTQTGPLRVRLDGDLAAVDSTPVDLVGDLHVGDRVWTQLHAKVLLVVAPAALVRGRRDSMLEMGRRVLSGGGARKATSTGVSWSQRFIVICNGRNNALNPSGYFNVEVPPDGTVIPVVGLTSQTQAVVAGGAVPLANWQCLYYQLPLGAVADSVPGNFLIAGYSTEYDLPPDLVPIALKQGDLACYVFGDGRETAWWKPLALQNGWANYGGAYTPAQYKRENGIGYVQGFIKSGTVGSSVVIAQVPEGYRPDSVVMNDPTAYPGTAIARVDMGADGNIVLRAGGSSEWIAINLLPYPVEQ